MSCLHMFTVPMTKVVVLEGFGKNQSLGTFQNPALETDNFRGLGRSISYNILQLFF